MDEWLPPGAEPPRPDDWHRDGGIALPDEYAEWSASQRAMAGPAVPMTARETSPDVPARFRIISPRDGDRYAVPPGVDARYATVALRASGGPGGAVRWEVDGRRVDAARIPLAPGRHVISAAGPGGVVDVVAIEVSAPASLASSP
jgi:hypothetical protein